MGARKQMTELDGALDRLSDAVDQLIKSASRRSSPDRETESRIARLTAERDKLRAEVHELKAQHDEDARLRAEAASAVRAALTDLRSVVAVQGGE